jgi:hypothetical protein
MTGGTMTGGTMNQLPDLLRRTVGNPPPSAIDLDQLIATEHQARRRRQAFTAGVAGVAVVGVGASVMLWPAGSPTGLAPATTAGSSTCVAIRPTPSSSNDPTVGPNPLAEPEAAAVDRLSTVLDAALTAHLPGRTVTDVIHAGCETVRFEPRVYPARYYAWVDVSDATGTGGLVFMLNDKPFPGVDQYDNVQTLPDGTKVGWHGPGEDGTFQLGVERADGTSLTVLCLNTHGRDHVTGRVTAPATVDEVLAIATDPGLTLFP